MVDVPDLHGPVARGAPRDVRDLAAGQQRDEIRVVLREPVDVEALVDLAQCGLGDAVARQHVVRVELLAGRLVEAGEVVRIAGRVEVVGERCVIDGEVVAAPGNPGHAPRPLPGRPGDEVEERLRARLAPADHAHALPAEAPRLRHDVGDVELVVAEQVFGHGRDPRAGADTDGDVVGGHRPAVGLHDEGLVEADGDHALPEDDVLVPLARPLQIVSVLPAGHRVELRVDEVVDPSLVVQVRQEREPVGGIREAHQVLEHRHLERGVRQLLPVMPGEAVLPVEEETGDRRVAVQEGRKAQIGGADTDPDAAVMLVVFVPVHCADTPLIVSSLVGPGVALGVLPPQADHV